MHPGGFRSFRPLIQRIKVGDVQQDDPVPDLRHHPAAHLACQPLQLCSLQGHAACPGLLPMKDLIDEDDQLGEIGGDAVRQARPSQIVIPKQVDGLGGSGQNAIRPQIDQKGRPEGPARCES